MTKKWLARIDFCVLGERPPWLLNNFLVMTHFSAFLVAVLGVELTRSLLLKGFV